MKHNLTKFSLLFSLLVIAAVTHGQNTNWSITGNTGTVDGTNFLGNTDNVPLSFRVNNQQAGRIDPILFNSFYGFGSGKNNIAGAQNTGVGYFSLYSNLSGSYNTANGHYALFSNNNGNYNTATGIFSLQANANGSLNTGGGYGSLFSNITGNNNTASGEAALYYNTAGNANAAFGGGALITNILGSNNTALGYGADVSVDGLSNATAIGNGAIVHASNTMQLGNTSVTKIFAGTGSTATIVAGGLQITGGTLAAGKVLTSDVNGVATWQTPAAAAASGWGLAGSAGTVDGTNFIGTTDNVPLNFRVNNQRAGRIDPALSNSFYGLLSGNPATTGGFNTAVGWSALGANTTGNYNTATGYGALSTNTTGNGNLALGIFALQYNTTGSFNSAIGYGALNANTVGTGNFANGTNALHNNISGIYNTASGYSALLNNTTGNYNIGIGYAALLSNTAGSYNTATGWAALYSNTTGLGNLAYGYAALRYNTTGSYNTATGYAALTQNYGGGYNSAYGYNALTNNVGGVQNTANGYQALLTNTYGNGNTALGFSADVATASLTNATAIGSGAIVSASNTIQLGNSSVTQVLAGTGTNATLVAGGLKITGGTLATGKVLTSDANGVATWQAPGNSTGWALSGNAGTVDGTNFIGTTDNVPLSFRVNNTVAGRIDHTLGNTFYGFASGVFNTSGGLNTAIGEYSLRSNNGFYNTATGQSALYSNSGGQNNTADGYYALFSNTNGQNNTGVGAWADVASIGGINNATAIGYQAMVTSSNTIQLGNNQVTKIMAGTSSNDTLVTGLLQVTGGSIAAGNVLVSDANGVGSWQKLSGGGSGWSLTGNAGTVDGTNFIGTTDNVPLSFRVNNQVAGRIDSTLENTFYGYQSGGSNTIGMNNTANGFQALYSNSSGGNNTANGFYALLSNTSGTGNTANGGEALQSNISGSNNTANGSLALFRNTYASDNTANGSFALFSDTTGHDNTANGSGALYNNTAGNWNTANGVGALGNNTTGSNNSAFGVQALGNNNSGSNLTAIGYGADINNYNNMFTNSTALGVYATITASNQVRIGSIGNINGMTDPTSIGGAVGWSTLSDGRVKKNIKLNVPGLAFINKLQPITYNLDLYAADKIIQRSEIKDKDGKTIQPLSTDMNVVKAEESILHTGFVAQDVEKAAKSLNYDFSGVDAAKNDKDLYGLRYAEFVVPLVKAVQELSSSKEDMQSEIDNLKSQNNDLQNQLNELKAQLQSIVKGGVSSGSTILSSAKLEQNIPNPFNQTTLINYYVPESAGHAFIKVTGMNGQEIKTVQLNGTGSGQLTLQTASLATGNYTYSLYVDGSLIDTKVMVLAR